MRIGRSSLQTRRAGFRGDERGNSAVAFALVAPVVLGLGGSTVDALHWAKQRSELQDIADTAALSATRQLTHVRIADAATREAKAKEQAHAFIDAQRPQARRTVAIDLKTNTVKVSLAENGLVAFSSLFGVSSVEVGASSTAIAGKAPERVCLLALETGTTTGIQVSGNFDLLTQNCTIRSNAAGDQSIHFNGNVKVASERICAAGKAVISGGSAAIAPMPESFCPPVDDPLASWAGPTVGLCTQTNFQAKAKKSVTLDPGVYCGGIDIDADDVTLRPGTYIVKDGPLKLTAKKSVVGEGVGIYLHGNAATIDVTGQASLKLTAQKSGPMAGMVLAQNRASVTVTTQSKITGGSTVFLEGTIYLPRMDLEFGGNAEIGYPKVTQVIARTIKLAGTANMKVAADFEGAAFPVVEVKATKLRITH